MVKWKKATNKANIVLDTFQAKPRRGRRPKVHAGAIWNRARKYRGILGNIWDKVWPRLSTAEIESAVVDAFETTLTGNEFPQQAALILRLLKDVRFPKRRQAQINYLADSLAALGDVSPRRSRDICVAERARAKRTHHILRFEFYVVCSCGYEGHSENHACPKCGASLNLGWGSAPYYSSMFSNY